MEDKSILHYKNGEVRVSDLSVDEILKLPITQTVNYDYESSEDYDQAKVILGRSNGIINPNQSNHQWAYNIYQNMQKRDWVPQQVNTTEDRNTYPYLSEQQKRLFHLVLAQLITNDSVQTTQLPKIADYITSPVIAMALTRHAYEEANHSVSYAVMEADIINKPGYIYNLHKDLEGKTGQEYEDTKALMDKNKAVGDMYSSLYNKMDNENLTVKDILLIMVANQILEELVFPGGFVAMYTLEKQLPGTVKMIEEIHKDETLSHVPLFKNIFRTTIKELFNGVVPEIVEKEAHIMIVNMVEAEIKWTAYIGRDQLGFSLRAITSFVRGQANSVCKNLGLNLLYEVEPSDAQNPLKDLLKRHLSVQGSITRSNNFENNNATYVKGFNNDF